MAKKRGRKSKRQYFTEDTEHAILDYLASENQAERNRIYLKNSITLKQVKVKLFHILV
jgi:hypothetical protein